MCVKTQKLVKIPSLISSSGNRWVSPQCCPPPWAKRNLNLTDNFTASSSFIQAVIHSNTSNIIMKELTEWDTSDFPGDICQRAAQTSPAHLSAAHMKEHTHQRSGASRSPPSRMKRKHQQKSKRWSDTARTRNEMKKRKATGVEHSGCGFSPPPTLRSSERVCRGDIQLVKALEGRVGNLIHLAKHHPRQLCVLWHPAFEVTGNQDEGRICGDLWAF